MSTVTPSNMITDGQIDKVTDLVRSQLRKHRQHLPADVIQHLLSIDEVGPRIMSNLLYHVQLFAGMVSFKIIVDSSVNYSGICEGIMGQLPAKHSDQDGQEVEIFFFQVRGWASLDDPGLLAEYQNRGFKPADPHTLSQFNFQHEDFYLDHPHVTIWQEDNGEYSYITFGEWRRNHTDRHDGQWSRDWWFAGVRIGK